MPDPETSPKEAVVAEPVSAETHLACRKALTDLYWLWKWYRDEFPDAEVPEHLGGFNGCSDTAGRAAAFLIS